MARTTTRTGSSDALIGRSTRIRGRISGDGDLVIEGTVEGDVDMRGALTVRGELDGDLRAGGEVRIEAGARVRGDVTGESFSLEEGAEFVGRVDAQFELPAELGGSSGGKRR